MNQSEFLEITRNLLKAREKSCVQGGFSSASHWWKNWREIFKPVTKCCTRNRVITGRHFVTSTQKCRDLILFVYGTTFVTLLRCHCKGSPFSRVYLKP